MFREVQEMSNLSNPEKRDYQYLAMRQEVPGLSELNTPKKRNLLLISQC